LANKHGRAAGLSIVGIITLIFKADAGDNVYETSERNNVLAVPMTITLLPSNLVPDLAPVAFRGAVDRWTGEPIERKPDLGP